MEILKQQNNANAENTVKLPNYSYLIDKMIFFSNQSCKRLLVKDENNHNVNLYDFETGMHIQELIFIDDVTESARSNATFKKDKKKSLAKKDEPTEENTRQTKLSEAALGFKGPLS